MTAKWKNERPKRSSLCGNVGMKIKWMAAISLLKSPWYPVFLEFIKQDKLLMPAACMEHISGICCVTVSFLYSYSIPNATDRALCSCQTTRMQHLLLSCQQSLAVNPMCLAQEDQCRFPSPCGTGLPAGLETPRPCSLILGSAWVKVKRLLLIHSSSRCNFLVFSNLKYLLGCLNSCLCTVVTGLLGYRMLRIMNYPSRLMTWSLWCYMSLSPKMLYLGKEPQHSLFLLLIQSSSFHCVVWLSYL